LQTSLWRTGRSMGTCAQRSHSGERAVLFLFMACCIFSRSAPLPAFEAPSIKLNTSGSGQSSTPGSAGQIVFTNVSQGRLIQRAYSVMALTETPSTVKPLSQTADAKRCYPKRNPGKDTPIASGFVACSVKRRTGKSAMMPTIDGCDTVLNGAATVRERSPREHEFTAPGQLAERCTPKPAAQNLPAYALAAGKNANGRKLTSST